MLKRIKSVDEKPRGGTQVVDALVNTEKIVWAKATFTLVDGNNQFATMLKMEGDDVLLCLGKPGDFLGEDDA